ncbi:MAG: hypothetical protein NZ740_10750, partial [Kiritimatiellae bacterium]|nr:hypothetical protein [Kiritimatiellia bacterium]MDW8459562.1 hypothetical protein [Verrucomicrobiota bacterium]
NPTLQIGVVGGRRSTGAFPGGLASTRSNDVGRGGTRPSICGRRGRRPSIEKVMKRLHPRPDTVGVELNPL